MTTTTTAAEYQKQGTALFMEREYEAAAEQFTKAKDAYQAEGREDMAHEMEVNLGLIDSRLDDYDSAVRRLMAARQYFMDINDETREAQVIGNLGDIFRLQGNIEQATTLFREAADTFREKGDLDRYGRTLMALAEIQMRSGKVMQAAATYEVALESVQDLNFRQKLMKGLLGVKNRLIPGGLPKEDSK